MREFVCLFCRRRMAYTEYLLDERHGPSAKAPCYGKVVSVVLR